LTQNVMLYCRTTLLSQFKTSCRHPMSIVSFYLSSPKTIPISYFLPLVIIRYTSSSLLTFQRCNIPEDSTSFGKSVALAFRFLPFQSVTHRPHSALPHSAYFLYSPKPQKWRQILTGT